VEGQVDGNGVNIGTLLAYPHVDINTLLNHIKSVSLLFLNISLFNSILFIIVMYGNKTNDKQVLNRDVMKLNIL
jgi:hypothetical protein